MNIAGLFFAQPLVLAGLLLLPLLWRLMRTSPPPPREQALPSLPLLSEITQHEESPAQTPWWLAILRLLLATLLILAFAEPRPAPPSKHQGHGPLLLVIDDGWTSAARWPEFIRVSRNAIAQARNENQGVYILRTTQQNYPHNPDMLLDAGQAERLIRTLKPSPWIPNRTDAAKRLQNTSIQPSLIIWVCDGLQQDNNASTLIDYLQKLAPLQIHRLPPENPYALSKESSSPDGPSISVQRASTNTTNTVSISARSRNGSSLALSKADFDPNSNTAQAVFTLPPALMNRVTHFQLSGQNSAGAVWIRKQTDIRPHTGLVNTGSSEQPLLNAMHYVQRALEPYAELSSGDLNTMLEKQPDAIILPDRQIHANHPLSNQLTQWIEQGGVLIRFAGPLLAAKDDLFIPTPLRTSARAMGGSLAWEKPQKLAEYPDNSPFAGITTPNISVRQQVLAEPGADLLSRTWARLEDGTPIVTAAPRGKGMIVLFHITATPDWSDLPYNAAFANMLHRAALSGKQRQITNPDGHLTLHKSLDGFGKMQSPANTPPPIPVKNFSNLQPGPLSPPGLYTSPSGQQALNAGTSTLLPLNRFPAGIELIENHSPQHLNDWQAWLLSGSILLLVSDIISSLALAGAFRNFKRKISPWHKYTISALLATSIAAASTEQHASAATPPRVIDAALNLRLAYVETGNSYHDRISRSGLEALGKILFQRTAVELAAPHAIQPGFDPLELYPVIFISPPPGASPISPKAANALNTYLQHGGAIFIDTRDTTPGHTKLEQLLKGLNIPPLIPVPADHVLYRSFYLLQKAQGRLQNGQLWIEAQPSAQTRGDGISGIFIGNSDWTGAWAKNPAGYPLLPMDTNEHDREYAYRFGVNLVMYVLTGNYKEDQVHLPDLLKRLRKNNPAKP